MIIKSFLFLLFLQLVAALTGNAQYVTTLAGSGNATFANGQGTSASFSYPYGLAVDSGGNVYVADYYNHRVRKITAGGVVTTLAGSGNATFVNGQGTAASFWSPQGVAVDASGNVYVADTTNHRIRKITSNGTVTTLAGSGSPGFADGQGTAASFRGPSGVAVGESGNVYVADTNNNRIRKVTAGGNVTVLAGSGGSGYADGQGIAASFRGPTGVAVDGSGNVYVADINNNLIRKVTPSGNVSTLAGSGLNGNEDGQGTAASFLSPAGVVVDGKGNVYVADSYNNRIRQITVSGNVTTLAGSGNSGSADGQGTVASFNSPTGVAVDGSGNVYVADYYNNRIRKIVPSPRLSLEQPVGTALQNSQTISFGNVPVGNSRSLTFTIKNTGTAPLTGLYINNYGWPIQASPLPSNTIAPGGNMTFTVTYTPYWGGQSSSALEIYSNDPSVNPFTINLTGNGLAWWMDSDGDGMNDSLEYSMSNLGFDWQVSQPALVAAYNVKIEVASPSTINLSGKSLTQDLVALGGTGFVWQVLSGMLPPGVSLNASGQISGTLTTPGNYKFTVKVTNAEGFSAYKWLQVRVVPPTTSGGGYNFINFAGDLLGFSGSSDASFIGSGAASGGFTGSADGSTGFTGSADAASREPLLYAPSGIAVDASGNIYVSDSANNQVRKVTSNGTIQNLAGVFTGSGGQDGTAWNARFKNPQGMATDASGNIYVADQDNHAIRKITANSTVSTVAGSFTGSGAAGFSGSADGAGKTAARFNKPSDVAVDSAGNIYVADSGNHAIRKISTNGTVSTLAGTMGLAGNTDAVGSAARFRSPQGIAVSGSGTVYVADTGNQVIRRITANGTVSTFAGAAFTGSASPLGGRASFTGSAHAAFIGSADATTLQASADGNATTARFSYPTDITIDSQGNFYVTDSATEKIRKISSNGTVTTLGGSPDGFFYSPIAIDVAANGTLYIADAGNNRIAMSFIPAPEISLELPGGILIESQAGAAAFPASLLQSATTSRTYTIRNVGYIDLTGLALSKNGSNAAEFALGALETTSLSAGNSTTFTVAFSPTSAGNRTAQIAVASNDADENPFVINLAGYGLGTLDFDGDGVIDAAEYQMSSLGFEWQTAQAGMASAFLAGVNAGGLYSLLQIQGMNIGTPLISKNATSGNFELTIGLQKSTNLQTFQHFSLNSTETTIEPDGRLKIRFSATENAAFFRLKAQ